MPGGTWASDPGATYDDRLVTPGHFAVVTGSNFDYDTYGLPQAAELKAQAHIVATWNGPDPAPATLSLSLYARAAWGARANEDSTAVPVETETQAENGFGDP